MNHKKSKAYWDYVKVTYGEIDYLTEAMHRIIYDYAGKKETLNPEQEKGLTMLCRAYKHWADIQDKGQHGAKFAQEPVRALVEKFKET